MKSQHSLHTYGTGAVGSSSVCPSWRSFKLRAELAEARTGALTQAQGISISGAAGPSGPSDPVWPVAGFAAVAQTADRQSPLP